MSGKKRQGEKTAKRERETKKEEEKRVEIREKKKERKRREQVRVYGGCARSRKGERTRE